MRWMDLPKMEGLPKKNGSISQATKENGIGEREDIIILSTRKKQSNFRKNGGAGRRGGEDNTAEETVQRRSKRKCGATQATDGGDHMTGHEAALLCVAARPWSLKERQSPEGAWPSNKSCLRKSPKSNCC